ncbi:MAG: tetratricopeptide repeat protein, partial [Chlamydiota bacterium]|nr:tetratricopeptide repeat protein [Chlamydiota bacterium]
MSNALRKNLGCHPRQLQQIRCLGYNYVRQGLYKEAKLLFRLLVTIDPNSEYDQKTLGAIYLAIGAHIEALHHLKIAYGITTNDPLLSLNLAQSMIALGMNQQAKAILNTLYSMQGECGD